MATNSTSQPNKYFGIVSGEKQATAGLEPIVDGLTTSAVLSLIALSTNAADILIQSKNNSSGSFRMKAGDTARLPLNFDNSSLLFSSSLPGSSLTFFSFPDMDQR